MSGETAGARRRGDGQRAGGGAVGALPPGILVIEPIEAFQLRRENGRAGGRHRRRALERALHQERHQQRAEERETGPRHPTSIPPPAPSFNAGAGAV